MDKTIKEKLDLIDSSEQLEELYSIFNSINERKIPLIHFDLEVGNFVIRQRINNKGEDFYKISELSYPPILNCKGYGRANIPYHPMFYCSSFAGDFYSPIPRYISLLETSDFINDLETSGIERATCSKWDVIIKLELLSLPFSTSYERTIPLIKKIQDEWKAEIQKKEVSQETIELIEYMSNEIAKEFSDSKDYCKIANFVYFLLYINNKTKGYDGILYPSVAAAGEGFNIVLKPESVDKKLQFSTASLCYLIKNKDKAEVIIVNHSVGQNEKGILVYEPMEDFNANKYKNANFIN